MHRHGPVGMSIFGTNMQGPADTTAKRNLLDSWGELGNSLGDTINEGIDDFIDCK